MIHKWLKEGMSKSAIAKMLGISRETVRKYANKPEGYIPVISKAPVENLVDEYLPHIAHMLDIAKEKKIEIPTTVIYDEIVKLGYIGSLRWLQTVMCPDQREEMPLGCRDMILEKEQKKKKNLSDLRQKLGNRCRWIGLNFLKIVSLRFEETFCFAKALR